MQAADAPRVPITAHPDVRRSLMLQRGYAEGLRALYMYAAAHSGEAARYLVPGVEPAMAIRINDLLLPVVKAVSADRGYEMLVECLQTFGGSGYLQDYPIEQYLRDSKVDSVYEGTTAVQALDFLFRKVARDGGATLRHVLAQVRRFAEAEAQAGMPEERALLAAGVADVEAMVSALGGYLVASAQEPEAVYRAGLVSVRFLYAVGDLLVAWRLLVGARIAQARLDSGAVDPFYAGKVAAASFFARTVLPRLRADRTVVDGVDAAIMQLDEAAL
jgi:hypothetical protein